MSRPKAEIDKGHFEDLCEMQCTQAEICKFFRITDKTLTAWCKRTYGVSFSEIYRQKRENGKISLRRYQFNLARSNANMAIWLGKNWLGQSDRGIVVEQGENSAQGDDPLTEAILEEIANGTV